MQPFFNIMDSYKRYINIVPLFWAMCMESVSEANLIKWCNTHENKGWWRDLDLLFHYNNLISQATQRWEGGLDSNVNL